MPVRIEPLFSLINAPEFLKRRRGGRRLRRRHKAVDLWTMRCAHRPACRGQRFALPTAQAFAHKLHSLPPPSMKPEPQRLRSYRGDKYCDAGGVDPGFQPLKPENAREHPVRVGKPTAERFIEHFACPAATSENRSWRTSCANLQTDTMRTMRGLKRPLAAPESQFRGRHRVPKQFPGSREATEFLASDIQMQAVDLRHEEDFRLA
jgi:hypothetical protein